MAPLLIAQKSKGISTWLENWNVKQSDAEYLASLLEAKSDGIEEDILTVCDQAPEHLRGNRLVYFARSQALQKLKIVNPRYEQLYFDALQKPPPMLGAPHVLELLLIPKLLAASDYQTADDVMEKIMSVIGDDAYLMCIRAEIKNKLGDPAAAKELLRQAHNLEPELPLLQELKRELQFKVKNEC
jgi:predicted Zn-dependent protease